MCVTCCSVQPPSRLRLPTAIRHPVYGPSGGSTGHVLRVRAAGRCRSPGWPGMGRSPWTAYRKSGSSDPINTPTPRHRGSARWKSKKPGISWRRRSRRIFHGHRSKLDLPRDSSTLYAPIGRENAIRFLRCTRNVSFAFCLPMNPLSVKSQLAIIINMPTERLL